MSCDGGGGDGRGGEGGSGMQSQKQKPRTMMWGKKKSILSATTLFGRGVSIALEVKKKQGNMSE